MEQLLLRLYELENANFDDIRFKAPATQNDIALLGKGIEGVPDCLKELLLFRNGDDYGGRPLLGGSRSLLSCEDIVNDYQMLLTDAQSFSGLDSLTSINADAGVKPYFWSRKWIPFLIDNDLYYAIDLNPDEGGKVGQIIQPVWENERVYKLTDSLEKMMLDVVNALESGGEWPYLYNSDQDLMELRT